jgi:L-alanine-DL-glutamate epimerase-like enolase superfamily enzyme
MSRFHALAAPERGRVKITDIRAMMLQGPRSYTLVKVLTDSGVYGIGEGYGSPATGVKEGVLELRHFFLGKDPLEIDALVSGLQQSPARPVSGIEMALWDLAGKLLGLPVATLLGGKFRDSIRVCHEEGPRNMLDRTSCDDWAARMKSHPAGFTAIKLSPPRSNPRIDRARDNSNRALTAKELRDIRTGFENCRNVIGEDYDLICQCHGEYDLHTAIQLAEAIEGIKPLWIEDAMPPDFNESWTRLTAASKVPIGAGESLARRSGFKDFIARQGCHIVQVDLRNAGGLLESKKIADMADTYYLPMVARNSGSIVATMATVHWSAAVRDFLAAETVIGLGNWMDDIMVRDGPVVKGGQIAVPSKPGLGIELNRDVVKANLGQGEKYWE